MATVEWARLEHAYGSAGDVPALLERAAREPGPADHRDEPWFSLWSALYHQDDIYSASLAAVPELIAIGRARRDAAGAEALFLAASIELARQAPGAPEIPADLSELYAAALRAARAVTGESSPVGSSEVERRKREIAAAVFSGSYEVARELLGEDGDPEES